ncbi:MAG TPA: membrane protein insertion efficiency factor YidD [Ignavibacteria bacterium]|nr:membrane protein insertion efficiency factor YidD [Ignavibacteria bacterium]
MKLSLSTPFILIIKLYQITLSPLMGNSCKFYPTCSNYAIEAFEKRGVLAGIYLTTKRILRCNPFSKGGYDPVPCNHKH